MPSLESSSVVYHPIMYYSIVYHISADSFYVIPFM